MGKCCADVDNLVICVDKVFSRIFGNALSTVAAGEMNFGIPVIPGDEDVIHEFPGVINGKGGDQVNMASLMFSTFCRRW